MPCLILFVINVNHTAHGGNTGILLGYNSRLPYFLVFTNLQCKVLYVKYAEYYAKKCFLALLNSLKMMNSNKLSQALKKNGSFQTVLDKPRVDYTLARGPVRRWAQLA